MDTHIKKRLYEKCLEYANQRIANIQEAIDEAVESANDDTKSSSGDKHETGRAMAQLEQEKSSKQLAEALEFKNILEKINPGQKSDKVLLGSLVVTNKGAFYISVAAGKLSIDDQFYFAISPASPLAIKLMGLSKKEEIIFNGNKYIVEEIV
ncbi:MAG: 3-oxoacyl-ACP synthase [Bacteroidia bacterium]